MLTACEKPEEDNDCNCGIIIPQEGDDRNLKIENYCSEEYKFINISQDRKLKSIKGDYAPYEDVRCFSESW